VQAALALFSTAGYAATTIQAVADEAGVAVQTVYAVFGNKRELLRLALEAAVTGVAAPLPLTERSEFTAIADEPDARRRAAMDAAMTAQMSPRIAPILKVVREAAAVDPDFATTLAAITAQRRADMAAAATILAGNDGPTLELEDAIGTLYVLYSPDVFTALTGELGWSIEQYERWLAEMLYRAVIALPARPQSDVVRASKR